jgi:hypothetical protein
MQNDDEKELSEIRRQILGIFKNSTKRFLRIFLAIVLSLSLTPLIFGGGWAVVNIGVISYLGQKNPEQLKSLKEMNKGSEDHPLLKESFSRTRTILGLFIPLAIGIVFGLVCHEWIFALIPFGISLAIKWNPILDQDIWLLNKFTGLGIGLVLLLLSSWICSKIRFSSKTNP